jgi:hypothetical protein
MIARYRGEHHHHGIWQPRRDPRPNNPATETTRNAQTTAHTPNTAGPELATNATYAPRSSRARARGRAWAKALALVLAGLAGFAAHQLLTRKPNASALPGTPKQWISAYEAAAIDNPQRVCDQLFAPQLAAAYAAQAHRPCAAYFKRIKSTSLRIRRILQDGPTAVIELHQVIERTNWDVVLARAGTGWRAVDLIPGRPLL